VTPETPPKAYEKEVLRRMNSVWSRVAYERRDSLTPGTAKFHFKVFPDGHISDLKMISNSGNEVLATVARRTIGQTRVPPIPRATLAELPDGYMACDCDFTAYY
jgi:outer membrane biosynthesis protein TonB